MRRAELVLGSALVAAAVGVFGLLVFFAGLGGLEHAPSLAANLLPLSILPVMVAAAISSGCVAASSRFEARGDFANAIRIVLLAYPALLLVLSATIWVWLRSVHFLPTHERPDGALGIAATAANGTALAFVVGVVPATAAEYFLVRFLRTRRSPAVPIGALS